MFSCCFVSGNSHAMMEITCPIPQSARTKLVNNADLLDGPTQRA